MSTRAITSSILPTTITGDMHSVNKANFAVTHWFGAKFAPRFTSLQAQLQHLYCASDIAQFQQAYLLSPAGQIDRGLITPEKDNVDRIIVTLGLEEMSQSTLIRKLCALSSKIRPERLSSNSISWSAASTRSTTFGTRNCNAMSIAPNRIEAYHQLRSAISQVGGKKQLIGTPNLTSRSPTNAAG